MKFKRKLLFVTAIASIVAIAPFSTFALSEQPQKKNIDYILENANPEDIYLDENGKIQYSKNYLNLMEEKNRQLKKSYQKYLQTKNLMISDIAIQPASNEIVPYGFCYNDRTLNVPTYQQERNHWCGPAAVKETLQFLNGSSLTQAQYASNMQTDADGSTIVYKLTNELNRRQSRHTYQYEDVTSESRFTQILIADVMDSDVGVPFILHALTGSLYRYNGNTLRHYLVVNGGNMPQQKVTYVDSWNADYGRGTTLGRYTDTRSNVANTVTSSGRFVIW